MMCFHANSYRNNRRFLTGCFGCIPIFLLTLFILMAGCADQEQGRSIPDVPVKTAMTAQKDVPVEMPVIGTVEAYSVVNITSRVDGQVMRIHIKEGAAVEKERLLFSIDDRPYKALLDSAQANFLRDQVRLEKARKDAVRYADLLEKDYVTKEQAEQAQADAESLDATVKGDEAALENAKLNVSYCRITSPITGRAGAILINEGNVVKANDNTRTLMVINQLQPVYVRFSVPEQRLPEIRDQAGSGELKVLVSAPGGLGAPKEGRLSFVDNAINPSTGTIDLKAIFDNTDNSLWPGQFVNVILMLGTRPQAIIAPSAAVQMGQQGNYVFVVNKDLTVEFRNVTTGPQIDDQTVIEDGLAAGEMIVIDGQLRLFPGAKVVLKNDSGTIGAAQQ